MSKETFDFSEALRRMKEGKKVRRKSWAACEYVQILNREVIVVNSNGDKNKFPTNCKLTSRFDEFLAIDWEEVEHEV